MISSYEASLKSSYAARRRFLGGAEGEAHRRSAGRRERACFGLAPDMSTIDGHTPADKTSARTPQVGYRDVACSTD